MKTKHIKYYILPVLLIVVLASCKKFLDVEPRNDVSDNNTITDAASAQTATRGVFNAFAESGYYGTTYQAIGYLGGDNLQFTGTQVQWNDFILHNVKPDNGMISSSWTSIYKAINRANHVIEKVPTVSDPKLTPALKDQLVGEAYFLRALAYFDLARAFGGVQIFLKPTVNAKDKEGTPRSTVDQVYAQVLADLIAAEPLLPSTINRVRVTQRTVRALRARYHLYRGEWADAETYATSLINDPGNSLVTPYNSWWANNVTNTVESIFELRYDAAFITPTSAHRNNWQPTQNGGNRNWIPNPTFRAILSNPTTGGNRSTLVGVIGGSTFYGNLYYRSNGTDPAYVLRIAEQYLIRAEARAKKAGPDLAGALADLDAVRTRAGLTASTAVTQAEIIQAIEDERRLEFAYEPHRWFDLVRTNRAASLFGISTTKYVLPIPTPELKADPALVQNPGY